MPYASERLRESRYAYSEDEVKQYFTEPRVLAGLYEVIETLFNVRPVETPVSSRTPTCAACAWKAPRAR